MVNHNLVGGWATYSDKMMELEFVSWDHDIPEWKNKTHVPNHQPANSLLWKMDGKMIRCLMYLWNMVIFFIAQITRG